MKPSSFVSVLALASILFAPRETSAAPRSAPPGAPAAPRVIAVSTARVHLRDLGIELGAMPDVDLGPSPPIGSTRTIDREDIVRALTAANAAPSFRSAPGAVSSSAPGAASWSAPGAASWLPAQVRIVRKSRKLPPAEVERMVRASIEGARLPKGATITAIRSAALEVPDGFDRISVELPAAPRRAGAVLVTAAVSFFTEAAVIARATVSVELAVPPEALIPDVAKGAAIVLVVRRGLVEVSIGAVAGADGDVNGVVPVLLKPSGRIVRARIADKDHAVAIEDS